MPDGLHFREYHPSSAMFGTVLAAVGVAVGFGILQIAADDDMPGSLKWGMVLFLLAVVGLVLVWFRRSATIVDREHIAVRGLFRTQQTAWADVQGIEIEFNPGAMTQDKAPSEIVVVYDRGGRRTMLPHLNEKSVHLLVREVEALRETWERLRGEGWEAVPEVAGKIAQRRAHRLGPWTTGLVAAMFAVPVVTVLFVVLLVTGAMDDSDDNPVGFLLSPLMILVVPVAAFLATGVITTIRRRQ